MILHSISFVPLIGSGRQGSLLLYGYFLLSRRRGKWSLWVSCAYWNTICGDPSFCSFHLLQILPELTGPCRNNQVSHVLFFRVWKMRELHGFCTWFLWLTEMRPLFPGKKFSLWQTEACSQIWSTARIFRLFFWNCNIRTRPIRGRDILLYSYHINYIVSLKA